jgi:hypothetical protein
MPGSARLLCVAVEGQTEYAVKEKKDDKPVSHLKTRREFKVLHVGPELARCTEPHSSEQYR